MLQLSSWMFHKTWVVCCRQRDVQLPELGTSTVGPAMTGSATSFAAVLLKGAAENLVT